MLVIRMQRTGRKGHAQFRVVVQDSRRTPTSGKIVASLGSYNPHTKTSTLDKEKAVFYMEHGAQPSDRVARLLKAEGVKLPNWVKLTAAKEGKLRNPEKLRRNRPAEEAQPEEAPAEEAIAETPTGTTDEVAEAPAETTEEAPASEESAAESAAEPAAEEAAEKPAE
jgi:small subunit ribosomal protein S16